MLNTLDFGIACDWACAAASKYDIENRIHVSVGLCGLYLAYLDDVSSVIGLSIGPVKEFWYYNRPIWTRKYDKEFNRTFFLEIMRTQYPSMFQTFSGNAHPPIKDYDKWADKDAQDFVKIEANRRSTQSRTAWWRSCPSSPIRGPEWRSSRHAPRRRGRS